MLEFLLSLIVKTPFYPHWLEFKNKRKGNDRLTGYFKGAVLETGAGNCEEKERILAQNKRVKKYIATDTTSWDKQFRQQKEDAGRFGIVSQVLYGRTRDTSKLDRICDALDLPFKNSSFDVYVSFEVAEHISDIQKFYAEAARVLKKGGRCITVSPFIYREHGGVDSDFQRITRGGYKELAKKSGMKVEKIFTQSFFGTAMAILVNQYVIRKILEGGIFIKILLLSVSPLVFFFTNSLGLILDKLDQDERFAPAYHVVMKKL